VWCGCISALECGQLCGWGKSRLWFVAWRSGFCLVRLRPGYVRADRPSQAWSIVIRTNLSLSAIGHNVSCGVAMRCQGFKMCPVCDF